MASFVAPNKTKIPETKGVEEGSAKRNITRKKTGKSGGGGSKIKKGNIVDDGSLYVDPSALDEDDPNYDSEEETGKEFIPGTAPERFDYNPELRSAIKNAKMTLSEYKKLVEVAIEVTSSPPSSSTSR
jgi:hypothetical protein